MVAMGASLGGLSAVLLAVSSPDTFVAVFSQSGSFFRHALDSQESAYPFFDRVPRASTPSPAVGGGRGSRSRSD